MRRNNPVWKWLNANIVAVVTFVIVGMIIVMGIGTVIANELNAISDGVIVNKWINSGGIYFSSTKSNALMHSYPTSYYFTIRGEKDGAKVEYTFEVSADIYDAYKIGDEYTG